MNLKYQLAFLFCGFRFLRSSETASKPIKAKKHNPAPQKYHSNHNDQNSRY
jgi:hypothetical protein